MKRIVLAVAALAAFAVPASANPNCAKDYKGFWDSFNGGPAKSLSAEQHAIVSRQALRAFDACTAGDEAGSKSIFTRLNEAAPAKGDDFWKALQQSAPAKK
ncbi:MAG: hypothetical protein ACKVP7_15155 [Hyphomicrobiaceae bacterium]